jgi:phage shock protein C
MRQDCLITAGQGYSAGMASSTLVRPRQGKWIAGVCAAIANRFGLPKWLVRLGFIIFGLVGIGEIVYIVLWILIPKQG